MGKNTNRDGVDVDVVEDAVIDAPKPETPKPETPKPDTAKRGQYVIKNNTASPRAFPEVGNQPGNYILPYQSAEVSIRDKTVVDRIQSNLDQLAELNGWDRAAGVGVFLNKKE